MKMGIAAERRLNPGRPPKKALKNKGLSENVLLSLISAPFMIIILIFSYVPLLGWAISFFDYRPGIKLTESPFIGLKNFVLMGTIFKDDMIRVMGNTLAISLLYLGVSVVPVILAVMISEIRLKWGARTVQTVTTFPYFISFVIVYSLFFAMFSIEGVVNTAMMDLHLIEKPFDYLGSPGIAWIFQTLVTLWKNAGWNAIIYIAAIAGIDQELYNAADVDGASRISKIFHVTLPGLSETFLVLLLLNVSNLLATGLDQYLVFMNDLVRDKIEVLDYFVYRVGLSLGDTSFATTVGMMKSVVSITLLFSVNAISKKVRGYSLI